MSMVDPVKDQEHLERVVDVAGLDVSEVVLPRHHQVILGDMRFHYTEWGASGNPPILFLHGGNQTARTWDAICLSLCEDFHCIALDQRGHGNSEWSYGHFYGPEDHAGDVDGLIDHLGWNDFVLVGMSMGCINGMHFAARRGHTLAGFVAVDAGPFINMDGATDIVSFVSQNIEHDSLEEFIAASINFNPRRKPELLRHSLTHSLRQTRAGKWVWKSDRRVGMDMSDMKERVVALERIAAEIACPTLVMRGGESGVYSDEAASKFAETLPNGRWVSVPGAGHTIQGDNPRQFVAELKEFLNGLGHPWAAR